MHDLDDTDREILRLLLDDARRPFSDIADRVGLSAPAVSDRVERLEEMGVVRGFTLDVDRSLLRRGVPVFVEIDVETGRGTAVANTLRSVDAVEHVFRTADESVVVTGTLPDTDVTAFLQTHLDSEDIDGYDVRLLAESDWTPSLGAVEFAPDCAECSNTVDPEGVQTALDGETYYFCCDSCKDQFVDKYESLKESA